MLCGTSRTDYELNKSLKSITNLIKRDPSRHHHSPIERFDKSRSFSRNAVMLRTYCESLHGYWFIRYWLLVNFEINFSIGLVRGGTGLDILAQWRVFFFYFYLKILQVSTQWEYCFSFHNPWLTRYYSEYKSEV